MSDDWKEQYRHCRWCGKELSEFLFETTVMRHQKGICSNECRRAEQLKRYGCCDQAEITFCVCTFSTKCPVHGYRCNGTHD